MEITETERLMLVRKKEEICGLTLWILGNACEPQNEVQIKKNLTMILSLLSTIASYSNSKNFDLNKIFGFAENNFELLRLKNSGALKITAESQRSKAVYLDVMTSEDWNKKIVPQLELFCNAVNSIRFDFTNKKGIKITLPNINLNFGNITNK